MNNFKGSVLDSADEVRTFPTLTMPPPVTNNNTLAASSHSKTVSKFHDSATRTLHPQAVNQNNTSPPVNDKKSKAFKPQTDVRKKIELIKSGNTKSVSHSQLRSSADILPGILKTSQQSIGFRQSVDNPSYVGFNASNLVFDGGSFQAGISQRNNPIVAASPTLSLIDFSRQIPTLESQDNYSSNQQSVSSSLGELRNYSTLMDQFSLHNFLIWNGQTLKNTPEYQSFKRTYENEWGPIAGIISSLERIMSNYNIKLAIVNGQKAADFALLGLPYYDEKDLLACISNIDQIRPMISSFMRDGRGDGQRAAVKIQSVVRQFLAKINFLQKKKFVKSAIHIQSICRRFIQRCRAILLIQQARLDAEEQWNANRMHLKQMWDTFQSATVSGSPCPRLVIHIPSTPESEAFRLCMENLSAVQNAHISCLHQLQHPDVQIVYISPSACGQAERAYHERFLQVLGISTLPQRLRFIVPDMLAKLPPQLPLAHALWYCSSTLRRLKQLILKYPNATIVSSSMGWAEKRISNFLKVPILAPDASVSEMLSTPSFSKKIFVDCGVSFAMGAHDIASQDDFMLALSRLIASNLDVNRWIFRLNSDVVNETVAILDTAKCSLVRVLRSEQTAMLQKHNADPQAWFSKHVQASVRKRLVYVLETDLPELVQIGRTDVFSDWAVYMRSAGKYGMVIEAEAPEILGHVDGMCFIDPLGAVGPILGADLVLNEFLQPVGTLYPQASTIVPALQGAVNAIASKLCQEWGVVGYTTVSFVSFWDAFDGVPRLWAYRLKFGMTPAFGGIGSMAAVKRQDPRALAALPPSLMPAVPPGWCCLHIPTAVHLPLRNSRDDVFFRQLRMNGIGYDATMIEKGGTLFFLSDSVMGGVVSLMCMAPSRTKALEMAIEAMTFIATSFGQQRLEGQRPWNDLNSIIVRARTTLRREKARDKQGLRRATLASKDGVE